MRKYLALIIAVSVLSNPLQSQTQCDTLLFLSEGSRLTGYFYSSNISKSPTLLFTQGFMGTGDIWNLGKTLSADGINVFMFDFRGCFNSEGKQGLLNSQEDIGSALDFLRSGSMVDKYDIDTASIIVGGYSYGGHMSMLYACTHPEVQRVISISGGDLGIFGDLIISHPDLRQEYSEYFRSIRKPDGPVNFEYDDPIQELIDNHEHFYILRQTDQLSHVDILMTGGLDDTVVSMEEYILPIYRKLRMNNTLHLECKIYQSGHSYQGVSDALLSDIENWIRKKSNP